MTDADTLTFKLTVKDTEGLQDIDDCIVTVSRVVVVDSDGDGATDVTRLEAWAELYRSYLIHQSHVPGGVANQARANANGAALALNATLSALEDDTIDTYNQFALVCRENGDSISMKIFEDIIDEEQIHFNYFDNVNGHIEKLGDTYLAKIAGTPSSTGLGPSGFAVGGGDG